MCWFAPIDRRRFLIVTPSLEKHDPVQLRYTVVSDKRFQILTRGYRLQPVVAPPQV